MSPPKVKQAKALNDRTLWVRFDNHACKTYDITPLLTHATFAPLKDPLFFRAVQVDKGGYAVCWNGDIDICEHELWCHGEAI